MPPSINNAVNESDHSQEKSCGPMPSFSIGCHTTAAAKSAVAEVVIKTKGEDAAALGPAYSCRAIFHLAGLLTEGESCSSAQLGSLAKLVHSTLAGILMLLGVHA